MPTSPTTINATTENKCCELPDYCQLDEYWFEDLEYWIAEFNSKYEDRISTPDAKEEKRETD